MDKNPKVPTKYTYGEMEELLFAFEDLLRKQARTIPVGSPLEEAGFTTMRMLATYKKEIRHDYKKDYRNEWRRALSMADILRKILSLRDCPAFNSVWPHILLLLGNGEIAQNLWSPKEDSHANYVFEMYTALLALPISSALDMEPVKTSANGENPDIIATIKGVPWGLACKVMHSTSAKSMLDRVRDGIRQIDRCRQIENGIVIVSLKNVIPHDSIWPVLSEDATGDLIYLTASSDRLALQALQVECKRYETELTEIVGGKDGFRSLFKGSKVEPVIFAYLCTVVSILRENKPTFTLIKILCTITVDEVLPTKTREVADALNESLHDTYLDPERALWRKFRKG